MRTQTDRRVWPFPLANATTHLRRCADFHGFVVNGGADVEAVTAFYGIGVSGADGSKTIADYLSDHLFGYPLTGDRIPLGGIELVVLKKSGRLVEQVGLDFSRAAAISRARSKMRNRTTQ